MKRTFWLASYPKSGNTWFRILLANLAHGGETPIDINAIDSTDGIASARRSFDDHLLISSALLGHDAVDLLRPALYAHLAERATERDDQQHMPVRFVKTHDGYARNSRGEPIMGGAHAAAGALLFVRDPRDVACSFAHHFHVSLDHAIATMGQADHCFFGTPSTQWRQLRHRTFGWSGFAASWIDQLDIPVHVIRYEDLTAAPHETVAAALGFVGWQASSAAIDRAIDAAAIDKLQHQEAEHGFAESSQRARRFFRKGIAGGWRDELSTAQIAKIEQDHWPMMQRFTYMLNRPTTVADSRGLNGQ